MAIRDDKQACGVLGYCCFLWWVPVCTVFWQWTNLDLAAFILRVFFAASAANSQIWWLVSYDLGWYLDSWTFWACGLWRKCQCWKIHQHSVGQGLLPAFHSGKLHCHSFYPFHARWSFLPYCEKDKGLVGKTRDKMFTMANIYQVSRLIWTRLKTCGPSLIVHYEKSLSNHPLKEDLINCPRSAWAEIPQETIAKLIKTIPERLQALRYSKRKSIRY